MKRPQLWIVVVITATCLLVYNHWRQEGSARQIKHVSDQQLPSGYVSNALVKQYGEDGKLSSTIKTPQITLFKQAGFMETPLIYNFHENCQKGWKTSALKGQLSNHQLQDKSNIQLSGDVKMTRADNKLTLETPSLEFYPNRSYVLGTEAVIIKRPNGQTTANGFSIDIKNQYYRLLSNVKNYYEPGKNTAEPGTASDQCLFKRPGQ